MARGKVGAHCLEAEVIGGMRMQPLCCIVG